MRTVSATVFPDYAAKRKTEISLSLDALAERIRSTDAPRKEDLPWIKFALFGPLSSPTNSGSLRWNGNVRKLSGIIGDYDDEEMPIEEAAERLDKRGIVALVYTSPSHMREGHKHRWRVCCPFSALREPDRHYQMAARVNGVLGGVLAPESFTLSQAYYFGSVSNNPAHQVLVIDGTTTIDRCDELDQIAIGKPNSNGTGQAGDPEAPIEDIRAALSIIPNPVPWWEPGPSWVEWNNVGMAVWRAAGGSTEGFDAFDKWSRQSPKYDGDETEFRWRHYFDSPPSQIGFGSLVHWAREIKSNWRPPSKSNGIDDLDARAPPVEGKPNPPPLDVLDFITLQDKPVPELRWLVLEWIPWRRVTGLYGGAGDGKTLLCQQLMTACATKSPWLGRSVFPVKSFAIFCEDDKDDLHRRQASINRLYDCDYTDLKHMKAIPRLGYDNLLMTFDGGRPMLTDFYFQVLEEARTFGAQLLIVDTVADTFGGNHNDPGQARLFIQIALGGLARELDAIVVVCAHPSRSGQSTGSGEFGSVQWDATVRSRLYLETPKENNQVADQYQRTLSRKKANYALRADAIQLRWKDGVLVNTDSTGIIGSIERRTCERVFLDLLNRITGEGRHVSESSHAPNYAPKIFSQRPDRESFRKADFEYAMQSLFAKREIKIVTYRKSGHTYDCVVQNEQRGLR
jgi:RecA-family ATPase